MSLGANICFLRKQKKYTQEQFAEKMGVTRQTISRWESNEVIPELAKLIEISDMNHLYKLSIDGLIIGGAILFVNGLQLNIGRIFVDPEYFRKGYGIFIMQEIERIFSDTKEIFLDTPIWNIRTNAFYQRLGYIEYKKDDDFIYYTKKINN